jgi:hypothetical protein
MSAVLDGISEDVAIFWAEDRNRRRIGFVLAAVLNTCLAWSLWARNRRSFVITASGGLLLFVSVVAAVRFAKSHRMYTLSLSQSFTRRVLPLWDPPPTETILFCLFNPVAVALMLASAPPCALERLLGHLVAAAAVTALVSWLVSQYTTLVASRNVFLGEAYGNLMEYHVSQTSRRTATA